MAPGRAEALGYPVAMPSPLSPRFETARPEPESRRIFELARGDRSAATAALDALSPEQRAALVCDASLARRAELLQLMSQPEAVIPLLPEAELCFTAKAVGLEDASWLLEHATAAQLTACIDLDGWSGLEPDRRRVAAWLDGVVEAGEETTLRAAQGFDPELLVLQLRERAHVSMKPGGDDAEDWQAPEGGRTLEGQFYLTARREGDDLASLMRLLETLFRRDYWLYFRLLQGAIWELENELEEWALRWRSGRLEELGFPTWDDAMRIYGYIRPEKRAELPDAANALDVGSWDLPVWIPTLPIAAESEHAVFRAARELDDEERAAFFYAFVGLANRVAVADRMPLGDADTLPKAIEAAAVAASRGLDYVAEKRGLGLVETLRRAPLARLFQVGANLGRDEQQRRSD